MLVCLSVCITVVRIKKVTHPEHLWTGSTNLLLLFLGIAAHYCCPADSKKKKELKSVVNKHLRNSFVNHLKLGPFL